MAQGGKFKHGFFAGMFASMAGSGMEASGWGVFSTGAYTMLFNHMVHQEQEKNQERFKGQLIRDRNQAAAFMQELSQKNGVEVSGWVVEEGVVVMPFEGENYKGVYQKNLEKRSHNNWLRVSSKNGVKYVHFNKGEYRMLGQIHTHPFNAFPSDADMNLAIKISLPVVSVSPDLIMYTNGVLISTLPRSSNINDLFK